MNRVASTKNPAATARAPRTISSNFGLVQYHLFDNHADVSTQVTPQDTSRTCKG